MGKPRKWSNVALPEQPEELSERELKIRAEMDTHSGKSMRDLAEVYAALVEEEDFETLAQKKRSISYEALERLILRQLERIQEETGHDSWRGDGQTFSPQTSLIPIVHDKQALMQHIKDSHHEALLTLEFSKLRSLVTDVLESFERMTPAERAALTTTLDAPIPGVKVWKKKGVHRTARKQKP